MLLPEPETWAASLSSCMESKAAITSGDYCIFASFLLSFFLTSQPTLYTGASAFTLMLCFSGRHDLLLVNPNDSVKVQVPHLVFSDSFLSAVLERGPLAPTSYLIIAPSTSWGFLSLLSTIIKSLYRILRFSYNLGTKCILINIHPRTNMRLNLCQNFRLATSKKLLTINNLKKWDE